MAEETLEERCRRDTNDGSRGGWVTVPFVVGTKIAVGVAASGLTSNLAVYLIQQFNIPRIDATQISNIVGGMSTLAPVVGALVSDLGPGCFNVIWASSVAGFLGMLLFVLITINSSLRPPPCTNNTTCILPTNFQLSILYIAVALVLAALGGTRFISATFGASQFDNIQDRSSFFNWYVVALYISAIVGITLIVYVQIGIGWLWGFSLCAFLSAIGIVIILSGRRYYLHPKPQKNLLLTVFSKLISSIRTYKMTASDTSMYYERLDNEEEEDLGSIIRLIPIMSTGVIVSICFSMLSNFHILQALVMNRKLFFDFTIPASSMLVFTFLATIVAAPLLRHVRCTPLQRICVGYVITTSSVAILALTEWFRLQSTEKMHVLWLVPGLVLAGVGEAWHFPGFLEFYYQELPEGLSSLSTGMIAFVAATGYFASASLVELVRDVTPWLKNDLNESRLDCVYWLVSAVGVLNLVYFLVCARFFKRRLISTV